MSAGDEFIMPVQKPDAVAEMHLHALRQISDSLTSTNRSLTNLAADVKDVRERVIKIESQDMRGQMVELRGELKALGLRVDALETIRDQQRGAKALVDWVRVTIAALVGAAVGVITLWGRT